jgi:hypothetical protein
LVENNIVSEDDDEVDRTDINAPTKEILATKGDIEKTQIYILTLYKLSDFALM